MMASGLKGLKGGLLGREIVATGGFGQAGALASLATVALPSSRRVVKATRFAGGFADLDRFARQWLLATMFFW
jgi:hypothetical protein